jgi:hypothetical protein
VLQSDKALAVLCGDTETPRAVLLSWDRIAWIMTEPKTGKKITNPPCPTL